MTLEPETLTPELLAKIEKWRWEGDASRLILNDIQILREMKQEEFERQSEEEKNKIIEEQLKVIKAKEQKVNELKDFFIRTIKDNGLSEDEINFVLELKDEIASPHRNGTRNDGKGNRIASRQAQGLRFKALDPDTLSQLQQWQSLYQQEFNLDISKDIESLYIPEKQKGFNWLIIIHKSLKPNQIYDKLASKFKCYRSIKNLDEIETIVERPNTDIYAIWIRDRIEADEEHKNKSADQIQQEGINPITLEERLLLELFYWRNNKKHLDLNNWTLCAGSRGPGVSVPDVYWSRGHQRLSVDWCNASSSHDDIRVRQAVSF